VRHERAATCARRSSQQDALGQATAQARELGGRLEELHDLLQLGLGLRAALDVIKRHPTYLRHVLLRAAARRAMWQIAAEYTQVQTQLCSEEGVFPYLYANQVPNGHRSCNRLLGHR